MAVAAVASLNEANDCVGAPHLRQGVRELYGAESNSLYRKDAIGRYFGLTAEQLGSM